MLRPKFMYLLLIIGSRILPQERGDEFSFMGRERDALVAFRKMMRFSAATLRDAFHDDAAYAEMVASPAYQREGKRVRGLLRGAPGMRKREYQAFARQMRYYNVHSSGGRFHLMNRSARVQITAENLRRGFEEKARK